MLHFKGSEAMNTAIFVEILAHFANSTSALTVPMRVQHSIPHYPSAQLKAST